jgi:hypothetical protein
MKILNTAYFSNTNGKREKEENIDIPRINSTWKPCYDTGDASMVKHMDNFNAVPTS